LLIKSKTPAAEWLRALANIAQGQVRTIDRMERVVEIWGVLPRETLRQVVDMLALLTDAEGPTELGQ